MDLQLDSDFSVTLDDRNDLGTVDGRDEFEQSVAIRLTDFLYDTVPDFTQGDTIEQKLRLEVNRVASDHEQIEEIDHVEVTRNRAQGGSFVIDIRYVTGETFSVEVEA